MGFARRFSLSVAVVSVPILIGSGAASVHYSTLARSSPPELAEYDILSQQLLHNGNFVNAVQADIDRY